MFIKTFGGCMRPLVNNGEIIFVKKTKDVNIGDIILYNYFGQNYLHRVIKKQKNIFVLEDDVGIVGKHLIYQNDIIGVCPHILNGKFGYIYHLISKNIFLIFRKIKQWLT